MKVTIRFSALALALCMLAGCSSAAPESSDGASSPTVSGEPAPVSHEGEVSITLSDEGVLVDGTAAPADGSAPVYTARDIVYYEDRDTYDSGNVYGEGTDTDKHTAEEAEEHIVVHITQPGTYRLSGTLSRGQIAVDLGEDAKRDPEAVVTLILDGANITCTVAPAVMFYNVYECDTAWVAYDEEEAEEYAADPVQDTSAAGANVILADGSVNNINGSYVARIYKDNDQQKKLHKYDGAFYSKMSMNMDGETEGTGVLNIIAENEGLDSELHLTINGGRINIQSQHDGVNTNEDGVSVTTINGGSLHIVAGLGDEGDGVDSNGYLVVNGGTVIAIAKPQSDSGLDSDLGSYINGGWVLATGSTMDWAESNSDQVTMNLQFASAQGADAAIIVTDLEGNVVFAYDPDKDETTGFNNRAYQGAILSCPSFAVGETYYVYVGGDVTGTEENGLYHPATVTGFDGAVRQQYTGTDVGMGKGGIGGQRPDGEWAEPPEGMEPGQRPEGEMPGQRPEGEEPPEMSGDRAPDGKPDGAAGDREPPEGWQGGRVPGGTDDGTQPGGQQTASVLFYRTDKVNSFSGISDEVTQ